MELAQLAAFVAVAEAGGFSAAAERLHLTQPAISKRIAQLEVQLDKRLFDRIGRQVVLTEAGSLLLPRAHALLHEAEAARRALQELGGDIGGSLRLISSHHIGLHRLPPLLRKFSARYPQVALALQFMDSEQAWDAVLHARAELALTTLGPAAPPLQAIPVWDDPLCCVAAPDHPLAQRKKLSPADLAAHPAVLPEAHTFTHRIVADAFASRSLPLALRMTSNSMETLKMLVTVGLAWGVLPQTMVDRSLRVLPVRGLRLSRQLGCIRHAGRTPSRAAQAFLSLLRLHPMPAEPARLAAPRPAAP
ncbi:MAG: LysR family transcriptional regulator [Ottowia sp.]|jgi:DNA-binding transcriptional LysR family regulator|nr:MAG: LysR family transcriptional regulator [Ottowia sp.]